MEYDIALFSPPSRMLNHYRPPISLLYIGGFLKHKGFNVKIIDVPLKEQVRDKKFSQNKEGLLEDIFNDMINEYKQIKSKIAGISCYTPEFFEVVKLAKAIKEINKSATVVVGGIHPTLYPEDFFNEYTGVDICVIGEGELTAYEVCQAILKEEKNKFTQIKGIAFFDDIFNKMSLTQDREPSGNLDDISFPDYSLIDMQYYTNANPYAIRGCFLRSMYILATRGCPSQCTFCVAKKIREFSGCGRIRSAESLISEIEGLREKYAIDSFYFIDDLFTINRENVKKFCKLLKVKKLNLLWGCSSTISILNEEIIKIMAEAKCIQIDVGVERGSDEALRLIKKGQTLGVIKKFFSLCHKYGIRTFANMLVNLPQETERDLADITKLLDEIKAEIVTLNIFTPYPGTEIYEQSNCRFAKDEYSLLSKDPAWLVETYPEKFKYCLQDIDLRKWVKFNSKHYNKILPTLSLHLSPKYISTLLKSRAKANYFKQTGLLIKEFINQKFSN